MCPTVEAVHQGLAGHSQEACYPMSRPIQPGAILGRYHQPLDVTPLRPDSRGERVPLIGTRPIPNTEYI